MKLLLLIPALAPVYGGTSRTAPAFAAALGRRGWKVDLVTTNANGSENLPAPVGRWIQRDNYREQYFARMGRTEYKPSFTLLTWLLRRVRDYDLVQISSTFNFPVLAGALACRLRGVSFVLTPHGMLEPWALSYKAAKKRAYFLAVERPLVLRGACAIQALNAQEAGNIRALGLGRPILTLPNGIDARDMAPGSGEDREAFLKDFPAARDKTLILFLHRVDPKKGLDLLAQAYAIVRRQFADTHLIVAGPDSVNFTPVAHGYFSKEGCGGPEAVTFTGMLQGALKLGALAGASVFVAPSYSEGFSMSVLEAMAAGLPCVITTGCNFPEAGKAHAVRETAIDAAEFAAALCDLLGDPEAARAMGARAREFVRQDYTWDKVAARFEALCGDRAGANGAPQFGMAPGA